ncbi:hypothetical protein NL387_26635, partial [Klebsiella pneumoniae]|nr:hypothetical protein [Klebsiella pneumoniae]
GKRAWQDMSSAWGKQAPEKWAAFHGSWGKRSSIEPDYEEIDAVEQLVPYQQVPNEEHIEAPEKKAWSALHGTWGKRPVKPMFNNEHSATTNEA